VNWPPDRHDWAGAVAFVVALFVSAGWAAAMIAAALDDDVSAQGVQLLAALGGVLAGAVAGYLGASVWGRRRHYDESETE
jgi:membrane associated rhomboid family serine protease